MLRKRYANGKEDEMILISHRGNIDGRNERRENTVSYIQEALDKGFDVEIDVWYVKGTWYLGHDKPLHKVELSFLENEKLWCHAKSLYALYRMLDNKNIHSFWHQYDDYTLTNKGFIWTFPNKRLSLKSIAVLPELWTVDNLKCAGLCSDYINRYE